MKVQRMKMGIWKPLGSRRERKRRNKLLEEKKEDRTSRCSGSKYQAGQSIDQYSECSTIQVFFFFLKLTILPPL